MSETHGNPSDHSAHAAPALPEPKTPMWLPAVGALFFFVLIVGWALMPASPTATPAPATAAADAAGAPAPR